MWIFVFVFKPMAGATDPLPKSAAKTGWREAEQRRPLGVQT
jgi:hypothetical protein